jgi:hypothetical protein
MQSQATGVAMILVEAAERAMAAAIATVVTREENMSMVEGGVVEVVAAVAVEKRANGLWEGVKKQAPLKQTRRTRKKASGLARKTKQRKVKRIKGRRKMASRRIRRLEHHHPLCVQAAVCSEWMGHKYV